MATLGTVTNSKEPWMQRLKAPAYQVKDAARYAGISPSTILNWQKQESEAATVTQRDAGKPLSYLQLIEVAVVAAMRKAGVSLQTIRHAREYVAKRLKTDYPFASHGFKTDGKEIMMDLSDFEKKGSKDKLIVVSKQGQLGWRPILADRLQEFDYKNGLAVAWHLAGKDSPVIIDPRVSFGAPAVNGIATWALKGRVEAGESVEEIAQDFLLDPDEVREALQFEGIDIQKIKTRPEWSH